MKGILVSQKMQVFNTGFPTLPTALYPHHQFLLHSPRGERGQEGVGPLLEQQAWKRVCYCSPAPSTAIFSVFLDFLCICSCSFLLSFSLCFSIFSWAFRAFSRDIFISLSFFLITARSCDDAIPRAWEGNISKLNLKTSDLSAYAEADITICSNSIINWTTIVVKTKEELITFAKNLQAFLFFCSLKSLAQYALNLAKSCFPYW